MDSFTASITRRRSIPLVVSLFLVVSVVVTGTKASTRASTASSRYRQSQEEQCTQEQPQHHCRQYSRPLYQQQLGFVFGGGLVGARRRSGQEQPQTRQREGVVGRSWLLASAASPGEAIKQGIKFLLVPNAKPTPPRTSYVSPFSTESNDAVETSTTTSISSTPAAVTPTPPSVVAEKVEAASASSSSSSSLDKTFQVKGNPYASPENIPDVVAVVPEPPPVTAAVVVEAPPPPPAPPVVEVIATPPAPVPEISPDILTSSVKTAATTTAPSALETVPSAKAAAVAAASASTAGTPTDVDVPTRVQQVVAEIQQNYLHFKESIQYDSVPRQPGSAPLLINYLTGGGGGATTTDGSTGGGMFAETSERLAALKPLNWQGMSEIQLPNMDSAEFTGNTEWVQVTSAKLVASLSGLGQLLLQRPEGLSVKDVLDVLDLQDLGVWYLTAFSAAALAVSAAVRGASQEEEEGALSGEASKWEESSKLPAELMKQVAATDSEVVKRELLEKHLIQLSEATKMLSEELKVLRGEKLARDYEVLKMRSDMKDLQMQVSRRNLQESNLEQALKMTEKRLQAEVEQLQEQVKQYQQTESRLQSELDKTKSLWSQEKDRVNALQQQQKQVPVKSVKSSAETTQQVAMKSGKAPPETTKTTPTTTKSPATAPQQQQVATKGGKSPSETSTKTTTTKSTATAPTTVEENKKAFPPFFAVPVLDAAAAAKTSKTPAEEEADAIAAERAAKAAKRVASLVTSMSQTDFAIMPPAVAAALPTVAAVAKTERPNTVAAVAATSTSTAKKTGKKTKSASTKKATQVATVQAAQVAKPLEVVTKGVKRSVSTSSRQINGSTSSSGGEEVEKAAETTKTTSTTLVKEESVVAESEQSSASQQRTAGRTVTMQLNRNSLLNNSKKKAAASAATTAALPTTVAPQMVEQGIITVKARPTKVVSTPVVRQGVVAATLAGATSSPAAVKVEEEDWSKLAATTLHRKKIKELQDYLEQKGVKAMTDEQGKPLKKKDLVDMVLKVV